jgi:hypothetical protein
MRRVDYGSIISPQRPIITPGRLSDHHNNDVQYIEEIVATSTRNRVDIWVWGKLQFAELGQASVPAHFSEIIQIT